MELNTTGQKDRGHRPPQPPQPPRYGTTRSTGQEIAATIVAGGSHDHAHVIVHRPPRDQLPRNSQPYPKATNRYRAVMENSDEEQDKYGNFERNSISSNTNVGAAYTSTRKANPHTGLQNQEWPYFLYCHNNRTTSDPLRISTYDY
jgi:hypothetical protein